MFIVGFLSDVRIGASSVEHQPAKPFLCLYHIFMYNSIEEDGLRKQEGRKEAVISDNYKL
jgi:hypothetical protein